MLERTRQNALCSVALAAVAALPSCSDNNDLPSAHDGVLALAPGGPTLVEIPLRRSARDPHDQPLLEKLEGCFNVIDSIERDKIGLPGGITRLDHLTIELRQIGQELLSASVEERLRDSHRRIDDAYTAISTVWELVEHERLHPQMNRVALATSLSEARARLRLLILDLSR